MNKPKQRKFPPEEFERITVRLSPSTVEMLKTEAEIACVKPAALIRILVEGQLRRLNAKRDPRYRTNASNFPSHE